MVPEHTINRGVSRRPTIAVQAVAVAMASFLTGAMASLSMIAIPVLLDTNTDNAAATQLVRQWVRTYHYGHIILPGICIGVCGLYGYAALTRRVATTKRKHMFGSWYAIAAVTTITMVPFTWLVMTPTNDALFRLEVSRAVNLSVVQGLVIRWAWLHIARSLFPLLGTILGFKGILRELSP